MPHSSFAGAGSSNRAPLPVHAPHKRVAQSVVNRVAAIPGWIARAYRVRAERQRLMALDARMLADIGISRGDALTEGQRAFYDLPHEGPRPSMRLEDARFRLR
ncbi:MAG: DUF1127 domain-containing protein [Pseudomonadota bacterium]